MKEYLPKTLRRYLSRLRRYLSDALGIDLIVQKNMQDMQTTKLDIDLLSKQVEYLRDNLTRLKDIPQLKIGFLVHNTTLFVSTYSIYQSLLNECQVIVYALPTDDVKFKHLDTLAKVQITQDTLKQHFNVDSHPTTTLQDLKTGGVPDILFLQTPYDEQRPKELSANYLHLFAKICYVPYSISIARLPSYHFGLNFFQYCWRIYFESPISLNMCKEYLGDANFKLIKNKIVVSGHPKVDTMKQYVMANDTRDYCWNLPRSTDVKRIIWAPHWSVKWLDGNGYSQFKKYYKYFLMLLADKVKIDIVLRPHQLMFDELIKHHVMTSQEVNSFIDEFNSYDNAYIDRSESYLDLFYTSDAMVTDGVSFLAEYPITKKPIIYTENTNNGPGLNEYGELIVDSLYIAHDEHDLDHLIKEVIINGNDHLYEKRMAMVETHLYQPSSGVGNYIKNNLFESIYASHMDVALDMQG